MSDELEKRPIDENDLMTKSFLRNSWHPIAFFSVWILLRRAVGRFAIQSVHFQKLIE